MTGERKYAAELWSKALAELRKLVTEMAYKQFFEPIVPLKAENGIFQLGVSDDFFGDWLANNYSDVISDCVSNVAGSVMKIEFVSGHVQEEKQEELFVSDSSPSSAAPQEENTPAPFSLTEKKHTGRAPRPGKSRAAVPPASANTAFEKASFRNTVDRYGDDEQEKMEEVCVLRPDFTFDNYIVGEENRYAFSAAMTAAQNQGVYNPLYIYGSTGMGKTHLIQAVANYVRKNNPSAVVRYVTCEAFLNAYLDSLHNKSKFHSHFEFRNYFREVDLLLIDDVHQLAGKEQLQEEFFNTFNTLHNANSQIILTSDKRPSEIPGLEARLVSRFESGLTTQITAPTFETRLSILQHAQENQSVKFSSDILLYVAERVSSSIRSLKAALLRLVAFASMTQSEVSISLAEELLGDMLDKEAENARVSIESIQKTVADHFGIRVPDITGSKRPKNIAEPRMIAMYLSRQMTDHSLVEIGAAFGGRNHATVLHAVNQITEDAEGDEDFRRTLSVLKRKIKG
ncbi:MAG: chromosomal replication initiator protein DnaA [Lentisphaeria bacterium]|nr:chromosomal replication initiator protein DnaA [Lentisphaeria bacterium]